MKYLLGNSSVPNYVKITATGLIAITYLAALGLAIDTYIQHGSNAQLPTIVSFVLGTGIGMALNVLGLHQGVSVAEGAPIPTTPQTTTTVSAQPGQPSVTVTTGGNNASTPSS